MAGQARPLVLEPDELIRHAPDGVHVLIVPGEHMASFELWDLNGGQRALVCYSSVQVLHGACGAGQPSRWVPAADVPVQCAAARAEVLVLDEPLPVPPRYPEPDVADVPDLPALEEPDLGEQLLYVPSRPMRRGASRVDLELQPYRRNRTLLAYTSPNALYSGCGPYQPWVAVYAADLAEVMTEADAERVLFNPVLAEQSRHTGPVRNQCWNGSG